jgi:hypothetical protein
VSVFAAATRNPIWGVLPPSNTVNISYTCPDGVTTTCVVVDVYRDGTNNSSTFPTFFLQLAGVTSQGTKARAIAEAVPANGTGCLRPWFLPTPTGLTTPSSYGLQVQLHENQAPDGTSTPSGYQQLDVGAGGNAIQSAIESCLSGAAAGGGFSVGDSPNTKPGGTVGPEASGVQQLIDWDPDSTVTGTGSSTKVYGGCGGTSSGCSCPGNTGSLCPNGAKVSPRVAVVAMCNGATDPNCNFNGQSTKPITITNFLAFFITGCNGVVNQCKQGGSGGLEIDATLVSTAGLLQASGGSATPGTSFLTVVSLIR